MVYSFQFAVNSDYNTAANAVRAAVGSFGRKVKEKVGGEFVFSSPVPGRLQRSNLSFTCLNRTMSPPCALCATRIRVNAMYCLHMTAF